MASRRDFIQKASVSAFLLPFLSSIKKDMDFSVDKPLRIAFCGLGSYAHRCAEAIKESPNVKVVGAITGTPSKIEEWTAKYGISKNNCYTYDQLNQLKNNSEIDVVYVTSVNAAHHAHTIAAAKAGKHVICEKPMAITVKEADEMIKVCNDNKVKLFIGYRLHFEPFTKELIRMRTSGELGQISFVNVTMGFKIGDPTQWRLNKKLAGGGAMYDVGVYCINGARYATGEDPVWVTAQEIKTDPIKFKEVDETITWQMGFPSGVVANCATTYNFNHFDRLYVAGNKDYFELSPAFGYGPLKARTGKGDVKQPIVTHQKVQLEDMASALLKDQSIQHCDGQEGLKDMIIIEAIYESIKKGGAKIMIKG